MKTIKTKEDLPATLEEFLEYLKSIVSTKYYNQLVNRYYSSNNIN